MALSRKKARITEKIFLVIEVTGRFISGHAPGKRRVLSAWFAISSNSGYTTALVGYMLSPGIMRPK
jgi:hypothetical protein